MAGQIGEWASSGWFNLAGGCVGTTPEQIRARAEAVRAAAPRRIPTKAPALRLAGLEPFNIDEQSLFVNVRERTHVTGSKAFARLVLACDYAGALAVAPTDVAHSALLVDVNTDDAMLDSAKAMTTLLNLVAAV